jgi:hypothetical protein
MAMGQGNIEFVENKGQWDSRVRYRGAVSNGAFFLRDNGFTMLQYNPADYATAMQILHERGPDAVDERLKVRSHAFHVDFVGASVKSNIEPDKKISTYHNYLTGNDPSKWAGGCNIYQAITIKDIYPNIDLRYYTDNGFLKYDLLVKPGGDVSDIALRYTGVDQLKVKNKELTISTSVGELKESTPYTYQATLTLNT